MGAAVSIVRIRVLAEGGRLHLVAERVLPSGEVDAQLAALELRHGIGSKVPRYWYYVGQMAFASEELALYRHDRMLVLGNDLIGSDELAGFDSSADEAVAADVWLALIQASLQLRSDATGDSGSPSRMIVEVPGRKVDAKSPFWRGLGAHFCPVDPGTVRNRFGEDWSAHVAALLPQQPVLVSLLSDDAQLALMEVDDGIRGLQQALVQSGFCWCRHVSIHDGGPVYELESVPLQQWRSTGIRTVDQVSATEQWLVRGSGAFWLVQADCREGALEVLSDFTRLVVESEGDGSEFLALLLPPSLPA